ncbi:MAG: tetratricopeptide repeat protein [Verrucomicrobiales bacterium]
MNRGSQALTGKKFAEAEKAFDEALMLKPGDAAAIKGKKDAVAGPPKVVPKVTPVPKGKDKDLEEDYQLAMSAGRAAMKQKNFVGAINSYDEALRKKPGDKVATTERAEAVKGRDGAFSAAMKRGEDAVKAKKYAEAIKAFEEAVKLKPTDAAAAKAKKEATDLSQKK